MNYLETLKKSTHCCDNEDIFFNIQQLNGAYETETASKISELNFDAA